MIVAVSAVNPPARVLVVVALRPGANGVGPQAPPLPSASTVKALVAVASGRPECGASDAVLVAVPQASGVASGAWAPPRNCSATSLNGTCGRPSKVAVSRPVAASAWTDPARRTDTPKPSATRKIR